MTALLWIVFIVLALLAISMFIGAFIHRGDRPDFDPQGRDRL